MTVHVPRRVCAFALALAGLWFLVLVPFHPDILRDDVAEAVRTSSTWQVSHVAMFLVGLVGSFAALGVVAVHDDRFGRVRRAALVVTSLGAVVMSGTGLFEATIFPEVARRSPELLDFNGPIFTDPLFRALSLPWMLFPAGFVGLGVLAHRDGAFGRAGATLAATALGFIALGLWFVPVAGQISDVAFGAALLWWAALVARPATPRAVLGRG